MSAIDDTTETSVPETLAYGILAMLRAEIPCSAAALTVRHGHLDIHRLLANDGYDARTARYLSVNFVRDDPHYDMVRAAPATGLCWADIPRFESSVLAREVLRPVGYREGRSMAVGPGHARGAALLHVSFDRSDLGAGIVPVVAAYADRCTDVVADQLTLQDWQLSPRELEVLRLLAHGFSNGEIADRLYVTRRTIATHVEHILAKSGASSRVAVAARATQLGLVRL